MASDGRKVWIGSIPHFVESEVLTEIASQYGKVLESCSGKDKSRASRYWALVTYSNREEAQQAIKAMAGKSIFPDSDMPVEARLVTRENYNRFPSTSNHLPPLNVKGASMQDSTVFKSSASTFSPTDSVSVAPYSTKASSPLLDPSLNGRCLWEQYTTSDGLLYYYNTITRHTQWEKPFLPRLTSSGYFSTRSHGTHGPPGSNLFIFHVPSDWTDTDLQEHFAMFGNIISAKVQTDTSGRNSGFGFVSFDNNASAFAAINQMNGLSVGSKFLKVQLKKGEEHYLPSSLQ